MFMFFPVIDLKKNVLARMLNPNSLPGSRGVMMLRSWFPVLFCILRFFFF